MRCRGGAGRCGGDECMDWRMGGRRMGGATVGWERDRRAWTVAWWVWLCRGCVRWGRLREVRGGRYCRWMGVGTCLAHVATATAVGVPRRLASRAPPMASSAR